MGKMSVMGLVAAAFLTTGAFAGTMDVQNAELDRLQALVQRRLPDMVELAKRAELEPSAAKQTFQFPMTDPSGKSSLLLSTLHAREEIPPYGCDRESSFEDNTYLMTVMQACADGACAERVGLWLLESNGQAAKLGGASMVVTDADAEALTGGKVELKLDGDTAVDFRMDGKRQALSESQLFGVLQSAKQAGEISSQKKEMEQKAKAQLEDSQNRLERLRDAFGRSSL